MTTKKNPPAGASRKEIALAFLRAASSGKAREAFQKYVAADSRHHNPYFAGDGNSLMKAMEENAAKNPGKLFEVQRALEDGDLVAIHSRVRQRADDRGVAVVHLLRFQGDRIVELWDLGQPVPEISANANGML